MTEAPIGVLCAIPQEIEHFGAHFAETARREIGQVAFRAGTLDGRTVVLAETGIGKVGAALAATVLAHGFDCRALVFSGVAGGLDPALGVGDVVVATRLVQHDYGAMIEERIKAYQPGVPPLPGLEGPVGWDVSQPLLLRVRRALDGVDLPPLSAAATGAGLRVPEIHYGPILTGDTFVNCEATRKRLHLEFGGLAVEMEGGAVAQVADRFGLPVVVVRALSDLAGAESHMDFQAFLGETAAAAALLVRKVVAAV